MYPFGFQMTSDQQWMCAACILLKLLNANITNPTMPRFLSKLQGEFSLKPVG
jgi:hypothetical protein